MKAARLIVCAALIVWLGPTAQPAAGREPPPGAVVGPVRLVPSSSEPLRVDGDHSYFGSIRLNTAADGIVVINRLPLERYLLGLQEVPLTWPDEALKAQAVAARTYALHTLSRPRAGAAAAYGFDICASVECQVFSGADVLASLAGLRWRQAVEDTAGIAVLHEGRPILARYHSTSGGKTFDNSRIFTGEPDYPYLQGVPSPTEKASPLYRWRVIFPVRYLERVLRRSGWWPAANGKLDSARTVTSAAGVHYPDIVFKGRRGSTRMSAEEFRAIARDLAPALWPDRYPSPWRTTSGFLPETLPSNRITVRTSGRSGIVVGRGWGHGVGMSQWGAYGMARGGASFEDILDHYYTGIRIGRVDETGPIRVGIGWGRLSVAVHGAFRIVDGRGRTVVDEALGTWRFGASGSGVAAIDPPKGWGLPLRVGIVSAPARVTAGEVARMTVALSKPARVRTVDDTGESRVDVADAGRRNIEWFAPDAPGSYTVRVEASVGQATERSEAVEITVVAPSQAAEPPPPEPTGEEGGGNGIYYIIGALLVAIILVGKTLAGRIRS